MATLVKTFSTKYGIDVANTIIVDSNRNLSNIGGANVVTANASSAVNTPVLNVTTSATIVSANITNETVSGTSNISTANIATANITQANAVTLNVATGNVNTLNVFQSNAVTLNVATGNVNTLNVVQSNAITLNVATGNVNTLNVFQSNAVTLNVATGNINSLNAVTGNINTLAVNTLKVQTSNVVTLNVSQDTFIGGNLMVMGNTTTLNTQSVLVDENVIFLAANTVGTPVLNADITVVRGAQPNVSLQWAENYGQWGYVEADGKFVSFDTIYTRANVAANTVAVYSNNGLVLANGNLSFVNSASANALVTANGSFGANVTFSVNTSSITYVGNLVSLNVTTGINAATVNASSTVNTPYLNVTTSGTIASLNVTNETVSGTLNVSTANVTSTYSANVNVAGSLNVSTMSINVNTIVTSAISQAILDIFPVTAFGTAKYFIQANSNTWYHSTEVILVQDGTNAYITEYGTVFTQGPLGTLTATVSGGNAQLLYTPASSATTRIQAIRYGLSP